MVDNKLRAIYIDGSRRIEALKLLEWAEPIRCVCYRNISDVALRGVLSDDSLRQVEMKLTLEQHGLGVEYGSRGGGLVSPKKALHLATGVDHFLVAHRQGDNFTCNEKVIPQKFDGMLRTSEGKHDPNTAAASVTTAVPYLGAKKRFSDDIAVWVIQRLTSYETPWRR
ncbi:expressed unknown protein [Ectocarpus siliculosus]|uniref:Uncharacterized protein n=1 Tax=Ectocarpus siliculosus TaxID=2880 RepID=D7FHF0_ECTSI|nr:expressed unknown protein [Ectocarpus siliculosus]|eukprot:CBJ34132.1 expressed unknown protein [Ectocarpus siliculosus]